MGETGSDEIFLQALCSNDDSLVMHVIKSTTVEKDIANRIEALPLAMIPSFFRCFTQFIQRNPEQLSLVLPWIDTMVDIRKNNIAASGECRRQIAELKLLLRQRTQQIGLFIEANSLSKLVADEKEGPGMGLPINEDDVQLLAE